MIDIAQFNKLRARSFNEQRALLKKLSKGQTVLCQTCGNAISLNIAVKEGEKAVAQCAKGCTHIELDVA
ncbi:MULTISPECIES: hypothetical protein [Pseudoalteromonas]|uniref:Uncharacterized protein n=1 Tax=Pseudoalteromonas luteoviolacea (strain 2ta16) TaxID=1353533 RepID=V4H329_PSEL2|nr:MULTISPECIES: hypothetical protein [Pseudoalteromonas]ESP91826.1 hypothetical protein PL2TA16_05189 [Pseudoalteromonas luteoviolacea 2ta16]KZN42926.1 hypothetical protein N483_11185 [Pseudoalteromonas luteoviolacea NCIMB 1944]MCG7549102.1 hypothetical protein [Pseudoalteromonas sp. Of7M-16]